MMINHRELSTNVGRPYPFTHYVVNHFLRNPDAIAREFLPFDHPGWLSYDSDHQIKKACNNWCLFPPATYKLFNFFMSPEFVKELSDFVGCTLYADPGLHGGGWHAHASGGVLKPHLDYNIHPKLGLQRKLNLIVYVEPEMLAGYGGTLGMWEGDEVAPRRLVHEVIPFYNRAVLFDTTQNSWHGMSRPLVLPPGVYRRSLAVYYLCEPPLHAVQRLRAEFKDAP